MKTHATIDIETLGTSPNTVVLTIGGIKFNPHEDDGLHSEFYYRLDADEQIEMGRTVDHSHDSADQLQGHAALLQLVTG